MRFVALALVVTACAQPAAPPPPPSANTARHSGCRDDIPDCVAACALRETERTDFVEWYDQRCATAILGRNPDRDVAPPPARQADLLDTR